MFHRKHGYRPAPFSKDRPHRRGHRWPKTACRRTDWVYTSPYLQRESRTSSTARRGIRSAERNSETRATRARTWVGLPVACTRQGGSITRSRTAARPRAILPHQPAHRAFVFLIPYGRRPARHRRRPSSAGCAGVGVGMSADFRTRARPHPAARRGPDVLVRQPFPRREPLESIFRPRSSRTPQWFQR